MSAAQRFFTRVLPKSAAANMEAESRLWLLRCPCGHERSVWDMGGIRWKASGNPRRKLVCPQCGENTWHVTYRKDQGLPQ